MLIHFSFTIVKVMCNKNQRLSNSARSTPESKKSTRSSNQNQLSSSSDVIGFCNLDLMPILLGNVEFLPDQIEMTTRKERNYFS